MALLHRASIVPTKLEAINAWLPQQPWALDAGEVATLGAFRFDDPAGEVGVETFLVRDAAGGVLQVPLTFRGAPLPDGERWLVTTMEHTVLGPRWVYDGCGDPAYVATLAATIADAAGEAREVVRQDDGTEVERDPSARAHGTGGAAPLADTALDVGRALGEEAVTDVDGWTLVRVGGATLGVSRHPAAAPSDPPAGVLTGHAGEATGPLLLATLTR